MSSGQIWLWFCPDATPVRGRIELNIRHGTIHLLIVWCPNALGIGTFLIWSSLRRGEFELGVVRLYFTKKLKNLIMNI